MLTTLPIPVQCRSLETAAANALVVIADDLTDLDTLSADIPAIAERLFLDSKRDIIEQITSALQATGASSLHIVAHGGPGFLKFGQQVLRTENLFRSGIERWREWLQGKDILLYGCQVARGSEGSLFLQQLHDLTGANIAASSQIVGRLPNQQTNWQLDSQIGELTAEIIFSEALQETYSGSFDPEISITTDIDELIEDQGTVVTFTLQLSEAPPASGLPIDLFFGGPWLLGDYIVFFDPRIVFEGGFPGNGFSDNSGLTFFAQEQTVNITLPVFDDPDRTENGAVTDPNGPLRNDDIGAELNSVSILPGEGYTVSPTQGSVELVFRDTLADTDFNSDRNNDVLIQNDSTGEVGLWLMDDTTISSFSGIDLLTGWSVRTTGDFDADLAPDVIIQNNTTGEVGVWLMDQTRIGGFAGIDRLTGWSARATGDFNDDNNTDILIQNDTTGEVGVWFMEGTNITGFAGIDLLDDWTVRGTGDLNDDTNPDVVIQNNTTGEVGVWFMEDARISGFAGIDQLEGWTVSGVSDFSGDTSPDIMIQNDITGEVGIWLMNDARITDFSGVDVLSGWTAIA